MRFVVASLALVLSGAVQAADDTTPVGVPITGAGTLSCGEYITHRRANYKPQMDIYVQWVDGFLSAFNMRGNFSAKWSQTRPLNMPDREALLLYVEQYCTKHPLDNVLQSTMSLVRDEGGTIAWSAP